MIPCSHCNQEDYMQSGANTFNKILFFATR